MNVKRFLVVGILGLFLISLMAGVLGADYSQDAANTARTFTSIIEGFFGELLKPLFGDQEMLSRVFFALLLGMIIYSIISVMFSESKNWIQWGIAGAITSLALIGLPVGFLESVRTSYGAMGAAILTVIPFVIIMIFSLRTRSILMARITWVFYAAYYLVMYLYKISVEISTKGWLTTETIPYLAGFIAGVFIFFFIPELRNLIFKGKIEGIKESAEHTISKHKLLKELKNEELKQVYGTGND